MTRAECATMSGTFNVMLLSPQWSFNSWPGKRVLCGLPRTVFEWAVPTCSSTLIFPPQAYTNPGTFVDWTLEICLGVFSYLGIW